MKKIAILASGSGTNAENIARFFSEGNKIRVEVVLTNRENAGVIERMNRMGIDTEYIPNRIWDENPERIVELLEFRGIDLIVLAGFMHYVSPVILNAFPERVLNIHPSLLPAYGGKGMWGHHVHKAVVAAGEKESGVTVHYVSEEFDAGEILMQQRVELIPGDTPESLESRIHQAEYELYPRAIVAALNRLSSPESETAVKKRSDLTNSDSLNTPDIPGPPAMPKSVEEEWAETLKVKYDPAAATVPPPVPGSGLPAQQSGEKQTLQSSTDNISGPEPMPPTYLLWAILTTLCCCFIPGIAAIVFSTMVSSRYHNGDIEGAKRASRQAEIWIIVSFVLGVLTASLYIPLSMAG